MKKKQKGFTLVELLVVIAILAILATVSIVGYTSFIERAEKSNETTEAHQIELSLESALIVNDCVKVRSADGNVSGIWACKDSTGKVYFATAKPDDVKDEDVYDLSDDIKDLSAKLNITGNDLQYGSVLVMEGVAAPQTTPATGDNATGEGGEA